jgi:hypothetical protein
MHVKRFTTIIEQLSNHHVPQMFATLVSLIAICLGVSMIVAPGNYVNALTLRSVFEFASPYAWGTVYILSAFAVIIGVFSHPRYAQAPLWMLAAAYAAQGILTIPQIANGGVPQSVFFLIGLAWICIATQLICGVVKERNNALPETIIHNQP